MRYPHPETIHHNSQPLAPGPSILHFKPQEEGEEEGADTHVWDQVFENALSLTHTHTRSLSHTHKDTHTLSLSHTHTHSHTHGHACLGSGVRERACSGSHPTTLTPYHPNTLPPYHPNKLTS